MKGDEGWRCLSKLPLADKNGLLVESEIRVSAGNM